MRAYFWGVVAISVQAQGQDSPFLSSAIIQFRRFARAPIALTSNYRRRRPISASRPSALSLSASTKHSAESGDLYHGPTFNRCHRANFNLADGNLGVVDRV